MTIKPTDWEPSYEWDEFSYGDLLAIHIKGHDIPYEDIDDFMVYLWDHEEIQGDFNIVETYLRKVPHHDGGMLHIYSGKGRGATPITLLEINRQWPYWCFYHPYEPATSGMPHTDFIDGKEIISERLKTFEGQVEPRFDVRHYGGDVYYLYMCRECSIKHHEKIKVARAEAMEKYYRETARETCEDYQKEVGIVQ